MPSPHSLRRLANLTKKVHDDLRKGGMAMNFRYLFRSTAILARVTAILADYVAEQAGAPAEEEAPRKDAKQIQWPNEADAAPEPDAPAEAEPKPEPGPA